VDYEFMEPDRLIDELRFSLLRFVSIKNTIDLIPKSRLFLPDLTELHLVLK